MVVGQYMSSQFQQLSFYKFIHILTLKLPIVNIVGGVSKSMLIKFLTIFEALSSLLIGLKSEVAGSARVYPN